MPAPFWPPASPLSIDQRVAWDGGKSGTAPYEISKARLKELGSIGHKVDRFLAARRRCWQGSAKAAPDSVHAWAGRLSAKPPGELGDSGLFACGLTLSETGFRLGPLMFPQQLATRLAQLWGDTDPEAPKSLAPAVDVPADVDAPLWLALLRLSPLREFWDRELRRATVDSLLSLLADAWVFDPGRVPEGAVIPRLEIASWSELADYRETSRTFAIATAQSWENAQVLDEAQSSESWDSATREALDAYPQEPRVLVDMWGDTSPSSPMIVAFYEKKAGRVDRLGAIALMPDAVGRLIPVRVVAE